MQAWFWFFSSLLHLCFPGGELGDMHIFCLSTLALESLNGAMFKARLKDFMMNALFVKISGNIDAEEQGIITYTVFYFVLCSVLHKVCFPELSFNRF